MLKIIPFPSVFAQADWLELSCLFSENVGISYAEFGAYLEQVVEEGEQDDVEIIVEDTMREIIWRKTMIGSDYPFSVKDDNIVKVDWVDKLAYSFQLLLSTHKFFPETLINTSSRSWLSSAKLFERFVTVAMKNYLGCSFNMGWPRKGGVPRSFLRSLDFASKVMNEPLGPFKWKPHWTGDQGVDVIAWGALDGRHGKIISLVNCAAGDDWNEKFDEVVIDRWLNYLGFPKDPIRAMAFPFICRTNWDRSMADGGILFDRLRLAYLFEKNQTSYLVKELTEWSESQIEKLPWIEE